MSKVMTLNTAMKNLAASRCFASVPFVPRDKVLSLT
jgi:hypothetical protein